MFNILLVDIIVRDVSAATLRCIILLNSFKPFCKQKSLLSVAPGLGQCVEAWSCIPPGVEENAAAHFRISSCQC